MVVCPSLFWFYYTQGGVLLLTALLPVSVN
jgi:hypothetical protein